jgi:hypothetical protein
MSGAVHLLAGLLLGLAGSHVWQGLAQPEAPDSPWAGHGAEGARAVPLGGEPGSAGSPLALWVTDLEGSRTGPAPRREEVGTWSCGGQDPKAGPRGQTLPTTVVVHLLLGTSPPVPGSTMVEIPFPAIMAWSWMEMASPGRPGEDGPCVDGSAASGRP